MTDYIYSGEEVKETWYEFGVEEAADEYVMDGGEVPENGIITIYRGEKQSFEASEFFSINFDDIREDAWDKAGEHSEGWSDSLEANEAALNKCVSAVFQKFCDENNLDPSFYLIRNVKPVKVKVALDEEGNIKSAELIQGADK